MISLSANENYMKRTGIKLYGLVAAVVLFASSLGVQAQKRGWKLEWQEDFNGQELDAQHWGYLNNRHRGSDWNRYMSDSELTHDFKKGKLVLRGIVNPDTVADKRKYLTGGITSQGKTTFKPPFRVEVRAKLGSAKGAWPAFWMMPYPNRVAWPRDGEIDIMEHLNHDGFVYQTVHSSYTKADKDAKPDRFVMSKIKQGKYNTYAVEVLEDRVDYFVNGTRTMSYPRIEELIDKGEFPFFHDWYLMLDMQLGGEWVGSIDPAQLPVEMEIDWVKYYGL